VAAAQACRLLLDHIAVTSGGGMADDPKQMGTFHINDAAPSAWQHHQTQVASEVEATRLGWIFAVALAVFLLVLFCVGSFLRFLW
jgi:hypothetical protein